MAEPTASDPILSDSHDMLVVQDYFSLDGTMSAVVERLQFADGTVWDYAAVKADVFAIDLDGRRPRSQQFEPSKLASQFRARVSVMAAFAPPALGQAALPTNGPATLQPLLAANCG